MKKGKTNLKLHILSAGLGSIAFAAFVGSISGSLAWWSYSTRVTVSYQGTSVQSSEMLQIGIKTDIDLSEYGMTAYEDAPGYYFCEPGAGLSAGTVGYYLAQSGEYAVDKLQPITSGSFSGGTLSLKESLIAGNPTNTATAAKTKYVKIPFAFRVARYNNGVKTYGKGENIWLTNTKVEASSANDGNVYKAIRMYCEGKKASIVNNEKVLSDSKFLLNPSSLEAASDPRKTAVAGPLNISGSDYYDVYEKETTVQGVTAKRVYEIIYGETEYTEDELLALSTTYQGTSSSDIDDFNNTGVDDEITTFTAKHLADTYRPADLATIKPKYAEYQTLATIRPEDDNGNLTGGTPICATDLTSGIADLNLTIWLEGWDHNVVDKESEHSFNLGLQFQINTI